MQPSARLAVAQRGPGNVAVLSGRDAIETMLAIRVIAGKAGRLDDCRLAFEPGTSARKVLRQRANAASLAGAATGALRPVTVRRMRLTDRDCAAIGGRRSSDPGKPRIREFPLLPCTLHLVRALGVRFRMRGPGRPDGSRQTTLRLERRAWTCAPPGRPRWRSSERLRR